MRSYVQGMTFETFGSDQRTIDAVVRNLTVIGEAAGHVPEDIRAANPDVPWRLMARMRNVVVHEYFGVDTSILWETIQQDLPTIVAPLNAISTHEQ